MRMTLEKWNLILGLCLLLLLPILAVKSYLLYQAKQETRALQQAVELLEASFDTEIRERELRVAELQEKISRQEVFHETLRKELRGLQKKSIELNTYHDEEKRRVARIGTADSLRDAIARRYAVAGAGR